MSQLQDKLDEINRQKQLKILPENIRENIEIFGITGQMTTENMWQPIRVAEGDYYLLSFVNQDGNFNVQNILGYDQYRIVKFYNDAKWYLYDVLMDKPKFICSTVPTDVVDLFGYTETDIFLRCKTTIKSYNLTTKEWTTRNTGLSSIDISTYNSSIFKHFYCTAYSMGHSNSNGLELYNPSTFTFASKQKYTSSITTRVQVTTNYVVSPYYENDYSYIYNKTTNTGKNLYPVGENNGSMRVFGLSYNEDKLFTQSGIYTFSWSNPQGVKLADNPLGSSDIYSFVWLNSKYLVVERSSNATLYEWDDETNTLTELQTINRLGYASDHYVSVIVGYSFMGQDYYFNTGMPISSDKILGGYTARDQYNQIVNGTMPNNGQLSYEPSKKAQTIPAGYTSGGVISAVTSTIDNNIKPENIRYGVEILGVAGVIEQDAAESVMTQEEYDTCLALANSILGV